MDAFWLILGLWEAPGSLLGLRAGFECSCALRGAFRCRLVVHFGLLFVTIWGSFCGIAVIGQKKKVDATEKFHFWRVIENFLPLDWLISISFSN